MKPMYFIGGVAVIGIIVLVFVRGGAPGGDVTDERTEGVVSREESIPNIPTDMPPVSGVQEEESMVSAGGAGTPEGAGEVTRTGSYEVYSPETLAQASEAGTAVLFFKATWCPSCNALDADIRSNVRAIPEGVTLLATDYDTYTDLRRQYGVTTQHTLVQVASDGTLVKKWAGGVTLASVVDEIQ